MGGRWLPSREGDLYAKHGSIGARRDELQRLCDRLQDGRKSQETLLDDFYTVLYGFTRFYTVLYGFPMICI